MHWSTLIASAAFLMSLMPPRVESSSRFYMKLDHYENYLRLLRNHANCDSGSSECDPAFDLTVRGSWGTWHNVTSCFNNRNEILFGDRFGDLANPIAFQESTVSEIVVIDVRVKDCLMDTPTDDIADFYTRLTGPPLPPFLYSDLVDFEDTERARTIDLTGLKETPASIKMRVTVWRQCSEFFYGRDCSKFCRPIAGHTCDPSGRLTCSGLGCPVPAISVANLATAATTAAGARTPRPNAAGAGAVLRSPASMDTTTKIISPQQPHLSGTPLVAVLSALLVAVAAIAAIALAAIKRCGQPKRRFSRAIPNLSLIPPTHSMAVGLRDFEPPQPLMPPTPSQPQSSQGALGTQCIQNDAYMHSLRMLHRHQPAPAAASPDEEEEDDTYEKPEDPASLDLPEPPPLPARNNQLGMMMQPQIQHEQAVCTVTSMSRSFSKPKK